KVEIESERHTGFWSSLNFWRLWGTATTMLLIVLTLFIGANRLQLLPRASADLVAILESQTSAPAWLVQVHSTARTLEVTTLAPQPRPPDRRFDFWLVPPQAGRDPILLGQLPASGGSELPLPKEAVSLLDNGMVLAVTLEPLMGTLSGESAGPVLYQGRLITP
ncbi:MAG: anti-sigma factor, partial [Candidatus Competibacteraceae bacterium]|nr:anti-sigma factor [Candidatus Competibacteraceae bacterium]